MEIKAKNYLAEKIDHNDEVVLWLETNLKKDSDFDTILEKIKDEGKFDLPMGHFHQILIDNDYEVV